MTYKERSKEIFRSEIAELEKVAAHIGDEMDRVVDMIFACQGKLVIMGIGKTGIIGHKIASSLASTGTQAIFVNAAEAMHGDLGMIARKDIVMLISNSGATAEILNVIAPLKNIGCTLIAMTGNTASPLAKEVSVVLNTGVEQEACPLNLAPTTSTTAALVMGDALTICLMEKRQFKAENFAVYHPGGALGRQLLNRVKHRMTADLPKVYEDTPFKDIIYEVSNKRLGTTLVFDRQEHAVGIITDGDIRRAIQKYDDVKHLQAADFMTPGFKKIDQEAMLTEALAVMDVNNITTLAVTASAQSEQIVGIISIHHIIDFN